MARTITARYTLDDVREMLKESEVQLYAIGIGYGPRVNPRNAGQVLLQELAEMTGGRAVFPTSLDELEGICAQISLELKNQYVLGFVSSNRTPDGRWRKLRVKVKPPAGVSHASVRAKSGYYAQTVD